MSNFKSNAILISDKGFFHIIYQSKFINRYLHPTISMDTVSGGEQYWQESVTLMPVILPEE